MKKILLALVMMVVLATGAYAMTYSVEYSKMINTLDKTSCNPMSSDAQCKTYRYYFELNYFDDARFFDDSGTKTSFVSTTGQSRYFFSIYFLYMDIAPYNAWINNITTKCIIWHNIYNTDNDINYTTVYEDTFLFGGGDFDGIKDFNLKGGEIVQCYRDVNYINNSLKRMSAPIITSVIEPAYEIQDESQCARDVSDTQSSVDRCQSELLADTSQMGSSAMLYIKKVVYYVSYGLDILFIIIRIAIIIGVLFLLFRIGFILSDIVKKELK
jgi:hypothetical protein